MRLNVKKRGDILFLIMNFVGNAREYKLGTVEEVRKYFKARGGNWDYFKNILSDRSGIHRSLGWQILRKTLATPENTKIYKQEMINFFHKGDFDFLENKIRRG